jgi:hypothetical protein
MKGNQPNPQEGEVTDAIDSQMWREWDNFLRLLSELELTHL